MIAALFIGGIVIGSLVTMSLLVAAGRAERDMERINLDRRRLRVRAGRRVRRVRRIRSEIDANP
jgi:hypothetical protein